MRTFQSATEVLGAVGQELGNSEWLTITQKTVNLFADATGDHQWIHVDAERAERESPFGGPIAHGYLSLSFLPSLAAQIYTIKGAKLVVNYGSNKVRYVNPVLVGARIRLHSRFSSVEEVRGGAFHLAIQQTLEIEGIERPALIAETISRIVFDDDSKV